MARKADTMVFQPSHGRLEKVSGPVTMVVHRPGLTTTQTLGECVMAVFSLPNLLLPAQQHVGAVK